MKYIVKPFDTCGLRTLVPNVLAIYPIHVLVSSFNYNIQFIIMNLTSMNIKLWNMDSIRNNKTIIIDVYICKKFWCDDFSLILSLYWIIILCI